MVVVFQSVSCDYCGGGSIGIDAGVLSGNGQNSIGLITSASHYKSLTAEEGDNWLLNWTLRASYAPIDKFQVQGFLPVYLQIDQQDALRRPGLGDVLFLFTYHAIDKAEMDKAGRHKFSISAGIELPTGKYAANEDNDLDLIPLGSKSVDFLGGLNYLFQVKKYVQSTSIIGQYNLENKSDYQYGKSLEVTWQHSLKVKVKDGNLQPFVGWKTNLQSKDISRNFYRTFTGGFALSQQVGMHWSYYNYSLSYLHLQGLFSWLPIGRRSITDRK